MNSKLLYRVLSDTELSEITKVFLEVIGTFSHNYDYEKIQTRILNLLVDETEYYTISDINKNNCIDIIVKMHPSHDNIVRESIKFLEFNNITMRLYYSYLTEGNDRVFTSYIDAYSYPEMLEPSATEEKLS